MHAPLPMSHRFSSSISLPILLLRCDYPSDDRVALTARSRSQTSRIPLTSSCVSRTPEHLRLSPTACCQPPQYCLVHAPSSMVYRAWKKRRSRNHSKRCMQVNGYEKEYKYFTASRPKIKGFAKHPFGRCRVNVVRTSVRFDKTIGFDQTLRHLRAVRCLDWFRDCVVETLSTA